MNHEESSEFEWEDQTSVSNYTNWAPGQPNNNSLDVEPAVLNEMNNDHVRDLNKEVFCVAIYRNGSNWGKWNDVNCNLKLAFICEKGDVLEREGAMDARLTVA